MEYTIEKLLAEEQWKQLNVIEGKESCKRKIEGIRIIEVPEMARYLTGGELLKKSRAAARSSFSWSGAIH